LLSSPQEYTLLYKGAGRQKRRKWKGQEGGKARTSAARPGGDNYRLHINMEAVMVVVVVMVIYFC